MSLPNPADLISQMAIRLKAHLEHRAISEPRFIGIRTGGVWVAQALLEELGSDSPLGTLDVSFYRDDFSQNGLHPQVRPSALPFEIEGQHLVLIDDVLMSGRTIRAAMNELFDYGRPASVTLVCLLDLDAGVLPIAELARPLDHLTREYKAHRLPLDLDEIELLLEAEALFQRGVRQLDSDPHAPITGAAGLIERTQNLLNSQLEALLNAPNTGLRIKRDPQLIANFLAQGMDILLDAESLLRRWQQHPGERQELSALLDELTTLGEGAHLADLHPMDELCEALLDLYGAVEESSLAVSERFFHEAEQAHEALINMLDQLAAGQEISAAPARVRALRELLDEGLDPSATGLIKTEGSRALTK